MRRFAQRLFSPGARCTWKGAKAWIDSFMACRTWNKHRSEAASCPWSQLWGWLEVGWAVLKCFDAWGRSSMRQWHIVEAPVGCRETGRRQMDIGPCCSSFRWANSDQSQLTPAKPAPSSPPPSSSSSLSLLLWGDLVQMMANRCSFVHVLFLVASFWPLNAF